jgi:hypothetical protein
MKSVDPYGLEPRQLWTWRFYGILLAALSWFLASLTVNEVQGSGSAILTGLLAVAAAIGSVMVMPIKAEWARWVFNMVVPFPAILVAVGAVAALF